MNRDCENCIHKVNGACNVWECKFEPKEDVEAEEGGQGMTKEEKEAVLHCLRSMIDEEHCEECSLYGTTGTDHCEKDCVRLAIEELEQDEYIKVPKKALKYRTAGIVAYNAEWLKNHFDIERAVICGVQEHYEDAISRQAVLDITWEEPSYTDAMNVLTEVRDKVKELPSVNPKQKWIPVSERLPKDFGTYLITLEGGDVCKCEFNPDFIDEEHENGAFTYYHQYFDPATLGLIDGEDEAVDAIAWMPFEPYDPQESEDKE